MNIPAEHKRIGMVFQRPHLFPHLSVKANLLYGYKRCAPIQRKITLKNLVDVLQIGDLLDRGVNNLSGGEKQRVAIGRTVLSNPRMLVMDEPLSPEKERNKIDFTLPGTDAYQAADSIFLVSQIVCMYNSQIRRLLRIYWYENNNIIMIHFAQQYLYVSCIIT